VIFPHFFTDFFFDIFMKQNTAQILEEELVISKATSHPEKMTFKFIDNQKLQLQNGDIVLNTMGSNFLGFDLKNGNNSEHRVIGNYFCGESDSLYELQDSLSKFLQAEDTLIFGSYEALCADVLESLLNTEDIIIYDSAISLPMRRGVKICKADKLRFPHQDFDTLENHLKLAQTKRLRVIVTDGIFYDSGTCANLPIIRQLAEKYDALVIVDDSYGFLTCGKQGRGADEFCGVRGFQDLKIVNMQNALCCNTGAFASGDKNIIELLKLRSRCYRNSICPDQQSISNAKQILEIISSDTSRIEKLHNNAHLFVKTLQNQGFECQKPVAGIVSFVSEMSQEKIKSVLRQNNLIAQYSKVGKNTLVSFKISASWDM